VTFLNKSDDRLIAVLNTGVQILTIDKGNKKVSIIENVDKILGCQLW